MRTRVHVCSFSSLEDMPKSKQRDPLAVLRVLADRKRFSIFEATSNPTIGSTLTALESRGWIQTDTGKPGAMAYPWIGATITEAGLAAMNVAPPHASDGA